MIILGVILLHAVVTVAPHFLPQTLGAWAAILAALTSIAAVGLTLKNRQKIQEVHVLVNSQMADIKGQLERVTGQRDVLQQKSDAADEVLKYSKSP